MIAFIGAMDEEVSALTKRMQDLKQVTIHHVNFYEGTLAGKPCVVLLSGVGKVNAAMSTSILLMHYEVDGVVNIGTAGGLNDQEEVFDVVVSKKVAQVDMDLSYFNWPVGFDQEKTCYTADPHYVELMDEIMLERKDRVWVGNIASSDSFIYRDDQVQAILKNYPDAMCSEMEAGGVASVCRNFEIPFIVIRSLSDITVRDHSGETYDYSFEKAAERSAEWCEAFIQRL